MPKGVYQHKKGYKLSEEQRNKLKVPHIGSGFYVHKKGELSHKFGKHPSIENPQKRTETRRKNGWWKNQKEYQRKRVESRQKSGYWKKSKEDIHKIFSEATTKKYLEGNFKYKGYFFSQKNNKNIGYRSSYELLAFQMLEKDLNVLKYDYEKMMIQYTDKNGQIRNTVPDLFVYFNDDSKSIIEIKPQFKIDKDLDNTKSKLKATEEFAKSHDYNFLVWTEKELKL